MTQQRPTAPRAPNRERLKNQLFPVLPRAPLAALTALLVACGTSTPPASDGGTVIGVNGQVLTADGLPAAGAVVTFLQPSASDLAAASLNPIRAQASMTYQTVTDRTGHYTYPDAPAGLHNLFVQHGALSAAHLGVDVTSEDKVLVDPLTLTVPGAITGTATLSGQSHHEGINVYLAGTPYHTLTAANGSFELPSVPAGEYRLVGSAFGHVKLSTAVTVTSAGTTSVAALNLLKLSTTERVSGTVSLDGGSDAANVAVSVPGTPYFTVTGAGGQYTLDLPAGTHTVQAAAPGYVSASTSVTVQLGTPVTAGALHLVKVTPPPPGITSVSPSVVLRGNELTIDGANFGTTQGPSVVRLSGVEVERYVSWSDTRIVVKTSEFTPLGNGSVTVGLVGQDTPPAAVAVVTPAVRPLLGAVVSTVVVRANGTVTGWGLGYYGETDVPVGLSNVAALAGGGAHVLGLKRDGSVVGWGNNSSGQTTVPAGLVNVTAVAAGSYHSLALRSDGTVRAWGFVLDGPVEPPVGLKGVVAIAAGGHHSLALKNDGTVVAWGVNTNGQTTIPTGLSNVAAISAGGHHSLALKNDGTVVAWGSNSSGQISVPPGLSNVAAISAGGYHSLALKRDGTVVGWGNNDSGQISVPTGMSNIAAISAGELHSLALKSDGTLTGWGSNAHNESTAPDGLWVLLP